MNYVAILIPIHKTWGTESRHAMGEMLAASRAVAQVSAQPLIGSSLLHIARNELVAALYRQGDPFTHVLFADDDMTPGPDALKVLLSRNVDVIGAAYTTRHVTRDIPPVLTMSTLDADGTLSLANIDKRGVHCVDATGTGFMLISRKALDAVADYTVGQRWNRQFLGMGEETAKHLESCQREQFAKTGYTRWFEFLMNPKTGKEYSEDTSFCLKAKQCGFNVYVDSTVNVGHIGNYAFTLDDYFRCKKGVS